MSARNLGYLIVAGLIGLLFLSVIFGSWYTIDQTQRGVLLRNGAFPRGNPPVPPYPFLPA